MTPAEVQQGTVGETYTVRGQVVFRNRMGSKTVFRIVAEGDKPAIGVADLEVYIKAPIQVDLYTTVEVTGVLSEVPWRRVRYPGHPPRLVVEDGDVHVVRAPPFCHCNQSGCRGGCYHT